MTSEPDGAEEPDARGNGLRHDPIAKTGAWIKRMLDGHLNYFAVSGNHPACGGSSTSEVAVAHVAAGCAAKRHTSAGRGSSGSSSASFRQSGRYTRSHVTASTPTPEGAGAPAAHAGICAGGGDPTATAVTNSPLALRNPACPPVAPRRLFPSTTGCFQHKPFPASRPDRAHTSWLLSTAS
jgi:hypothetical protein